MKDDVWCLWPDGFMCPIEEMEEWIPFKSEPFQVVNVTSYDKSGEPCEWCPKK